jgi:DNA processing protein
VQTEFSDYIRAIAHIPGISAYRLRQLREQLRGIRDIEHVSQSELIADFGWPLALAKRFAEWRRHGTFIELREKSSSQGIRQILRGDKDYPQELLTIHDAPECLFVRGSIPAFPAIAFVGSRRNTSYGKRVIETLLDPLAHYGLTLVSGLALGIDGLAHERALEKGMPTVAILGTGVDDESIYPREHYVLAQRILAAGGALVSEYPPGTSSRKEHFPQRNRLIAGMSLATIVIEAGMDSGSLITARLALEQGREVLAVPGPIWSPASFGCHQIIKLGARLCESSQDILDALALDRPALAQQTREQLPLTPDEQALYAALEEPTDIDTLCARSGRSSPQVLAGLSLLELKGYIRHEQGLWHRAIGCPKR